MPIRVMLNIMDSREITEWSAYFRALKIKQESPDELALVETVKSLPYTANRSKVK